MQAVLLDLDTDIINRNQRIKFFSQIYRFKNDFVHITFHSGINCPAENSGIDLSASFSKSILRKSPDIRGLPGGKLKKYYSPARDP